MAENTERNLDKDNVFDDSKQVYLESGDWLTAYTRINYSDRVHPDKRIEPGFGRSQFYQNEAEFRRIIIEDVDYGSVTFNQGAD